VSEPRDSFLSDEDLDLANLSWEELLAWWDLWLHQAQASNEHDEHLYSHGVFTVEPGWVETAWGVVREEEAERLRRGAPPPGEPRAGRK
jgi:hypothetical protein